jgi:hypothetical protein
MTIPTSAMYFEEQRFPGWIKAIVVFAVGDGRGHLRARSARGSAVGRGVCGGAVASSGAVSPTVGV